MKNRIVVFCLYCVIGIFHADICFGIPMHINLPVPLSEKGVGMYQFGLTASELLGKPFPPGAVPGPCGEEYIIKRIKDSQFGFDSLHLGFTMESQQLCNIELCRNFDYATGDSDMITVVSNVYLWVKSNFGDAVKLNSKFNLHSPPSALYASVENNSFKLQVEASHRQGPCWVMISLHDKYLENIASAEYDRIICDDAVKSSVKRRKQVGVWFLPLMYALPFYLIFCLPIVLIMMMIYVLVMKIRKQKLLRVIHWIDPITLLVAPYVWGSLEHIGQSKSLSNICEFAIIGWIWCICMAVRYVCAVMGIRAWRHLYGYITFVIVALSTIMLAILFPSLPE